MSGNPAGLVPGYDCNVFPHVSFLYVRVCGSAHSVGQDSTHPVLNAFVTLSPENLSRLLFSNFQREGSYL